MLILSAHQPAFLPWLGLIEKVILSDIFIVMDIAKFRKRAFMHRNKIEINGKPHILGIHTNNDSDFKSCDEIEISKKFKDDLFLISEKIKHTYKKSKYWIDVSEFCEETLLKDASITNLVELSLIQLKYLCQKLKINSKIVKESSITNKVDVSKLNASQRLFFHANYFKANIYITGINSLNYLDKTSFAEAKIYNYIQNFNYNFFNSHQKCKEPLSIVHQIANLGFKNISEWLFKESNFKKEEMINTFNSSLKKGFNQ